VSAYIRRKNGRCPADDFRNGCQPKMWKRFRGSFDAVTKIGARYCNHERFKPVKVKPIWEFKEHDHRLYCGRIVQGTSVEIILLNGWVKDKKGRSAQEDNEIEKAKNLFDEYASE